MRILWLKSDLLLPLDKGGKLRTWHLMRHLARRHEITYLAFAEPDTPASDVDGMREVAARVETIARSEPAKGTLRFYADAAMHVIDPLPYAVGKYRSRAFRQRVEALVAERPFDVIVCDFLFPAVNLPKRLPCPAVIFTHNVESEIWRRHAETKSRWLGRMLYGAQYRRMLRYEGRTLARFDGVLAVSDVDGQTFTRLYPGAVKQPVHVVQTGVDTDYFTPQSRNPQSRNPQSAIRNTHLVFTGSMDWLPNEDAMQFFCRDVLPLVRAEAPDTTLTIVGRAPTPAVKRLADDHAGVRVTGRVDDVRPFVRDAAVYVVPLRIGGGTRLKIFEAMAMGKAVVSTTVGAEGLPVVDGTHVVLADDPRGFADAILRLMRDPATRGALEASARALVLERYDWSAVAGQLEDALLRMARASASEVREGARLRASVGAGL
ncbi:MAG: group 1 glycosyl transferase [Acidobacteria bacterium]|nr:MAG: group 1 glycosyl transferase [Acidobacteriota bacterium]